MQYSKQKSVVQESSGIRITEPDDIIISADTGKITSVTFLFKDKNGCALKRQTFYNASIYR